MSKASPELDSDLNEGEVERSQTLLWTMDNFYAKDEESNIIMDGDLIKAATLPKLIANLTSDDASM